MSRVGYYWAQWRHGKRRKDPTFRIAPAVRILRDVGALWRGAAVLDIGARNRIEPQLLEAAGWRVTAVDLWPFAGGGIRWADMHALPFADGNYDAVVCSHVLEHAHSPDLALKEVCRVLRPRGLLWAAWPRGFVPNAHDRVDYGSSLAFVTRVNLTRTACRLWSEDGPTESRALVRVA